MHDSVAAFPHTALCCVLYPSYCTVLCAVSLILHCAMSTSIPVDADPKECFKVGQVVVCRVVSSDPSQEKLQLSLEVSTYAIGEWAGRWAGCVCV